MPTLWRDFGQVRRGAWLRGIGFGRVGVTGRQLVDPALTQSVVNSDNQPLPEMKRLTLLLTTNRG